MISSETEVQLIIHVSFCVFASGFSHRFVTGAGAVTAAVTTAAAALPAAAAVTTAITADFTAAAVSGAADAVRGAAVCLNIFDESSTNTSTVLRLMTHSQRLSLTKIFNRGFKSAITFIFFQQFGSCVCVCATAFVPCGPFPYINTVFFFQLW